jgi:hypothetical protein
LVLEGFVVTSQFAVARKLYFVIGEGYFGSIVKAKAVGNINGWPETEVAIKMIHGP